MREQEAYMDKIGIENNKARLFMTALSKNKTNQMG